MARIFISHRREDEGYAARGINDALRDRFGGENVYFDLDSMRPGLDWRIQIDQMVAECDVMLVIIGDNWLQEDASGVSRLRNKGDLVSLEVTSALKRDIPVIPVLVGNATIPADEVLPDEMKSLAYRQAVEVRASANFTPQIERLINSIAAVVPEPARPEPRGAQPGPAGRRMLWALLALIVIVISLVVWIQSSDIEIFSKKTHDNIAKTPPVVEPVDKKPLPQETDSSPDVTSPEKTVPKTAAPDTTPPVLAYTGPGLDSPLPLGSIELAGTVTDDSVVAVSVNGKDATVSGDRWTYPFDMTIGVGEIRILATDASGNESVPLVFKVQASPSRFLDTLPPKTVAALWIESPEAFVGKVKRSPFGSLFQKTWLELSSEWTNTISQIRNRPGIGTAPTIDDLLNVLEDEVIISVGYPRGGSEAPSFLIQASLESNPGKFQQQLENLVAEISGGTQISGARKTSPNAGTEYIFSSDEFRLSMFVKDANLFASLDRGLAENAARSFGHQDTNVVADRMRKLLLQRRIERMGEVLIADVDESFALFGQLSGKVVDPWARLLGAQGGLVDLGAGMTGEGLAVRIGFPAGGASGGFLSLLQADSFAPGDLPEVPGSASFYLAVAGNVERGIRELMRFFDDLQTGPGQPPSQSQGQSRRQLEEIAGANRSLNPLLAAMGNRVYVYGTPEPGSRDYMVGLTLDLANQHLIQTWLQEQYPMKHLGQSSPNSPDEVWEVTRNRLIFGHEVLDREVQNALNSGQTRPRTELVRVPNEVQAVAYANSDMVTMFFSGLGSSGQFEPRRLNAALAFATRSADRYLINLELHWE